MLAERTGMETMACR